MRKSQEISDPNSCLNKAKDSERLFVLLGRDPAVLATVRTWIAKRIEYGKNKPDDPKIREAEAWIDSAVQVLNERRIELAEKKSREVLNDKDAADFDALQKAYFEHLEVRHPRKPSVDLEAVQKRLATKQMPFADAERLCRGGWSGKIRRLAWTPLAYLRIQENVPMLLDLTRGAFWDLTAEDRAAIDWVDEDASRERGTA